MGCKTYNSAIVPTHTSSENKLPLSLDLEFCTSHLYERTEKMYFAYYDAIKNYFNTNIANHQQSNGSLAILFEEFEPYVSDFGLIYATIAAAPALLFGSPSGLDELKTNCTFQIKDKNSNVIKSYQYTSAKENKKGLYYGKTYRRFAFDEAVSVMEQFYADYTKDLTEIKYALQHPQKAELGNLCLTNPFTKPVYFEIDEKYYGVIPASSYKTIELVAGKHKITSYKSFYTSTTTQEVGGTLIFGFGSSTITNTQNNEGLTYEQAKKQVEPNTFRINITKDKTTYIDNEKQVAASIISQNNYTAVDTPKQPVANNNPMPQHAGKNTDSLITPKQTILSKESDIDKNIPTVDIPALNIYTLIIANEDYEFLDKVLYAKHDGQIFKEYCLKTLGIPERQIFYYENATPGKIMDGVSKLQYCLDHFENSKAIVYYCGHGIPDEKTGEAYLVPIDGKGTNMSTCYSLNTFYKTFAATKAESVTYFMDACFTGANKEGSMLVAARGVAREPRKETLAGKSIVFSASSGNETAMTLEEQGHGLFTYYLLKKLQETKGEVTYGELSDYIIRNVQKDAFLINEKPQNPVVATSPAVASMWKNMKLK